MAVQLVQSYYLASVFYCNFFVFLGFCVDLVVLGRDITYSTHGVAAKILRAAHCNQSATQRKYEMKKAIHELIQSHIEMKE